MTGVLIRDAVADDMTALSGVYRRSSLSNDGDRPNLLAYPETLEFSDLAVRAGRTRAAVAEGEIVGFASWIGAADAPGRHGLRTGRMGAAGYRLANQAATDQNRGCGASVA